MVTSRSFLYELARSYCPGEGIERAQYRTIISRSHSAIQVFSGSAQWTCPSRGETVVPPCHGAVLFQYRPSNCQRSQSVVASFFAALEDVPRGYRLARCRARSRLKAHAVLKAQGLEVVLALRSFAPPFVQNAASNSPPLKRQRPPAWGGRRRLVGRGLPNNTWKPAPVA